MEKKGIALNPNSALHFLDHLAPISSIMRVPFAMTEEGMVQTARKYYPDVDAVCKDRYTFDANEIFTHYDVLYLSDYFAFSRFEEHFKPLEKVYNKTIRIVHVPHGFSDKGFYLQRCALEDILLVYGQHLLDMLEQWKVKEHLGQYVITGNFRHAYFNKYRSFYQKILQEEILDQFHKKQPILLYAPTWNDAEQSSSFFEAASGILKNLPDHFNMIVKLHPNLEEDSIAEVYELMAKYEDKPNVLFLSRFPPIYPLLSITDAYIGDMSAVGYDYLVFNKPMFFLNSFKNMAAGYEPAIYRCGTIVAPAYYNSLYSIIETSLPDDKKLFSQIRSELYQYTFGPEKSFEQLHKEITEAYENRDISSGRRREIRKGSFA